MDDVILKIEDLTVTYNTEDSTVHALNNVAWTCPAERRWGWSARLAPEKRRLPTGHETYSKFSREP